MMIQLRTKLIQKFLKKSLTVHIIIRYHKSSDDIISEFQRFFFVEKQKNMIQLKIMKKEQKMKKTTKKKQRRIDQIDDKRLRILTEYNCTEFKCFNYSQDESVKNRCVVHEKIHYKLTQETIQQ